MGEDEIESLYIGELGLDVNYFWYTLTPRQAFNILDGTNKKRRREFEQKVFIERKLHCIIINALTDKKHKITEDKYWPLDMDKDVKKASSKAKKSDHIELESGDFLSMFVNLGQKIKTNSPS